MLDLALKNKLTIFNEHYLSDLSILSELTEQHYNKISGKKD